MVNRRIWQSLLEAQKWSVIIPCNGKLVHLPVKTIMASDDKWNLPFLSPQVMHIENLHRVKRYYSSIGQEWADAEERWIRGMVGSDSRLRKLKDLIRAEHPLGEEADIDEGLMLASMAVFGGKPMAPTKFAKHCLVTQGDFCNDRANSIRKEMWRKR